MSLLNFRQGSQETSRIPNKKDKVLRRILPKLNYQKLEDRRVLASFTFDSVASLLTIDGFDDFNSDLSIDQNNASINGGAPEDAYIFTLGAGTFNNGGGFAAAQLAADVQVSGNTLTIGTDFFGANGGLDANVLIDGTVSFSFVGLSQTNIANDLEFGSLEVSNFQNMGSSLELNIDGDVTLSNLSVVDNATLTMPIANLSITTTGSIDVNGTLDNAIENLNSGISLSATGGDSDVAIDAAVTTVEGSINVAAGDEVTVGSTGSLTSADLGNISVTSNIDASVDGDDSDGIIMADGSVINAGAGEIALSSTGANGGDIVLGSITTSNATSNAVTINSNMGVTDGGNADPDIVADSAGAIVSVDATAGVGDGNALEIESNSIDVENTTLGNIELTEGTSGGNINILNLDNAAANGNITVQTVNGSLFVNSAGAGITSLLGTVTLEANGLGSSVFVGSAITTITGSVRIEADEDVAVNTSIATNGGDLEIISEDDIRFSALGDIASFGGAVTVSADFDGDGNGAITMTDGAFVNAGSGTIILEADEDITLGGLATSLNSGNVIVTSNTGEIIDGGDTNTDIVAAVANISATAGVGRGFGDDALEVRVGNIDVANSTVGDINLLQLAAGGDINVIRLENESAAGDITLATQDGNINVVAAPTGAGIEGVFGTVTLDAQGAGSDVILNNTITTAGGDVYLDAANDVEVNAGIFTECGLVFIGGVIARDCSVVSTTLDTVDAGDLGISLREAIDIANDSPGQNTITFDGSVFTGGAANLIRLTQGELLVNESLIIDGALVGGIVITGDADGDDITISGTQITDVSSSFGGTPGAADDLLDDNSRVLRFSDSSGNLTLAGLTITGGRVSDSLSSLGGGIWFTSHGTLSLADSNVSGNSVTGNLSSGGGGIYTGNGDVSLTDSTISGNSATGEQFATGGGFVATTGDVSLINSTVSGNSTTGGANTVFSLGGGIYTLSGDVSIVNSTLTGNSTFGTGGAVYIAADGFDPQLVPPRLTVRNSIIAGNFRNTTLGSVGTPNDLFYNNGLVRGDNNLIGVRDGLTLGGGASNLTGTEASPLNPLLLPLNDNGGLTLTHALLQCSPAVDAGNNSLALDKNGTPPTNAATLESSMARLISELTSPTTPFCLEMRT